MFNVGKAKLPKIKAKDSPIDYDKEPKLKKKLPELVDRLRTDAKQMVSYTHADAHNRDALDIFIGQAKKELFACAKDVFTAHRLKIKEVARTIAAETSNLKRKIDAAEEKIKECKEKIAEIKEKHPEAAMQDSESIFTSFYARKVYAFLLLVGDFSQMYILFDLLIVEYYILVLITTFATTFCYDYFPIIMAEEVNKIKADKNHDRKRLYIFSAIFLFNAALTFALRLATRKLIFTDPFDDMVANTGVINQISISPDSPEAYLTVIVLGIVPFFTSLISFWLALKDTPQTVEMHNQIAKKNRLERTVIRLYKRFDAMFRNIEAELLEADQEVFDAFINKAYAMFDAQKNYYIKLLCMKNQDADVISILTEPPTEEPEVPDETPVVLHKASYAP